MFGFISQDSSILQWVIIPLLIFVARIMDVSVGTVRVIFVARGFKYLAPLLGFFEVLIWLLAIGQIMQNLSNPMSYIAYGAGFATGNYIGIILAEKMSLGVVLVRVLTSRDASTLIESLKQAEYGVTVVDGQGAFGPVKVLFTIVPRHQVDRIIEIINRFNPQAFYSIEEIDAVTKGKFPSRKLFDASLQPRLSRPFRKSK